MTDDVEEFKNLPAGTYFEWRGDAYVKAGTHEALQLPEKKSCNFGLSTPVGLPWRTKGRTLLARLRRIREEVEELMLEVQGWD